MCWLFSVKLFVHMIAIHRIFNILNTSCAHSYIYIHVCICTIVRYCVGLTCPSSDVLTTTDSGKSTAVGRKSSHAYFTLLSNCIVACGHIIFMWSTQSVQPSNVCTWLVCSYYVYMCLQNIQVPEHIHQKVLVLCDSHASLFSCVCSRHDAQCVWESVHMAHMNVRTLRALTASKMIWGNRNENKKTRN